MKNVPKDKKLIIFGASGHGKVVADIARLNGYTDIVFLDDNREIKECLGYPVVGTGSNACGIEGDLFVAIGDPRIRKKIMNENEGRFFPVLIHPNAVIAKEVEIGAGTVIMAGAVINPGTRMGRGCIINTCASVDHDCVLGDYVHVAVGAHVCGTVKIGDDTWIGAGATVINNVDVCDGCIIGAGAVVIKEICESGTYIGIPAKKK